MSDDLSDIPELSEIDSPDADIGEEIDPDADIDEEIEPLDSEDTNPDAEIGGTSSDEPNDQKQLEQVDQEELVETDQPRLEQAAQNQAEQTDQSHLEERPTPFEVLQQAEIDHRTYMDSAGRQMDIRLDNGYNSSTIYGSDYCQFGLYHEGNRAGHLDMALNHEPADPQNPEGSLKYTDVHINYVEVAPEYQHAGNGTELLNTAEQVGNTYGAERITGFPENEQARQFFESQAEKGWEVRDGGRGYNSIVRELKRS